jgi:hypothetical protein
LNHAPSEVLEFIQGWWSARKVPSQLPFLLDAIELLERDHPDRGAPTNLWFDAAEWIRRSADALTPSEKELWRRVGRRLGVDDETLNAYVLTPPQAAGIDLLANTELHHIAIVSMRERQARDAASQIEGRAGARVTLVTGKTAGPDTLSTQDADVVLVVWMATTHAVFRAYDNVNRKRLCYVQGTGSASIVRTLERFILRESQAE